ncbi:MAG TPA: hypothetical protein PKA10_13340 [Selenomonadales bacterium]|nr:hypothetical protein [Selenomonadales bacterium]
MPYNNNPTRKEQSYLEDALQMENLCLAKCSVYADQCQDQALKSLLFEVAKTKRHHANRLKQLLGQQSNGQASQQYH